MDPVSALLAIAFVVGIIRGMPAVIAELREAGLADADARRIARLTDAGIEPAKRGGAVGRYLGNLWREHVTGRGQGADRTDRPGSLRQRLTDAARRLSDRWRGGDGTSSPRGGGADGSVVPTTTGDPTSNGGHGGGGGGAPRQRDPIRAEVTVDKPTPGSGGQPGGPHIPAVALPGGDLPAIGGGGGSVHIDDVTVTAPPQVAIGTLPGGGDPTSTTAGSDVEPARDPIRTVAIVGVPARGGDGANAPLPITAATAPHQITGGTTMSGAVEVTGVSSGLAAAQAIQAQVQAAVEQFAAAMAAVDRNLAVVEAGAAGLIQFDGRGEVMQALASARGAATGARARAYQTAEIMTALLVRVAATFRRRL